MFNSLLKFTKKKTVLFDTNSVLISYRFLIRNNHRQNTSETAVNKMIVLYFNRRLRDLNNYYRYYCIDFCSYLSPQYTVVRLNVTIVISFNKL